MNPNIISNTPDQTTATQSNVARGIPRNTLTRIFSTTIALPIIFIGLVNGGWLFALLIALVVCLGALELIGILRTETHTLRRTLVLIALLIGLGLVGAIGVALRERPDGLFWWLLVLIATFSTDTLAFAGGRTYGRTPLLPDWSPKKTVEGTITGIVGGIVIGVITLLVTQVALPQTLLIVSIAPFLAVIGDLLESKFKRVYHVKDSAAKGLNVVPGHGGILDRIDSLSFVLLFVYLALWVLSGNIR